MRAILGFLPTLENTLCKGTIGRSTEENKRPQANGGYTYQLRARSNQHPLEPSPHSSQVPVGFLKQVVLMAIKSGSLQASCSHRSTCSVSYADSDCVGITQAFEAFRKEHAAVLEAHSLAAEDVLAKTRIMALLVLGARREEVTFAAMQVWRSCPVLPVAGSCS